MAVIGQHLTRFPPPPVVHDPIVHGDVGKFLYSQYLQASGRAAMLTDKLFVPQLFKYSGADDWARFNLYSPCIRRFSFPQAYEAIEWMKPLQIAELLTLPERPTHFFPNLHHVSIWYIPDVVTPVPSFFSGLSLLAYL